MAGEEEEEGALTDAADQEGSEGDLGSGLEAGAAHYDPLGSPLNGRDRKLPAVGGLIGSLRPKRAMEPEWSVAAADEEEGVTPRLFPTIMAEAGASRVRRGKDDGVSVHVLGHGQSRVQDGIEMQLPRHSEDSTSADDGYREIGMPGSGVACQ